MYSRQCLKQKYKAYLQSNVTEPELKSTVNFPRDFQVLYFSPQLLSILREELAPCH